MIVTPRKPRLELLREYLGSNYLEAKMREMAMQVNGEWDSLARLFIPLGPQQIPPGPHEGR